MVIHCWLLICSSRFAQPSVPQRDVEWPLLHCGKRGMAPTPQDEGVDLRFIRNDGSHRGTRFHREGNESGKRSKIDWCWVCLIWCLEKVKNILSQMMVWWFDGDLPWCNPFKNKKTNPRLLVWFVLLWNLIGPNSLHVPKNPDPSRSLVGLMVSIPSPEEDYRRNPFLRIYLDR